MKIIFSMDDVLVESTLRWVEVINEFWNQEATIDDITDRDIALFFPSVNREYLSEYLQFDWFWYSVKPSEYAIEYLRRLKKDHEVYVATTAELKSAEPKLNACLLRNFPFIEQDDIIILKNKALLDCDWLIDDNPDVLKNSKAKTILIDRPWNRQCDTSSYIYRAKNLKEAYEIINNTER